MPDKIAAQSITMTIPVGTITCDGCKTVVNMVVVAVAPDGNGTLVATEQRPPDAWVEVRKQQGAGFVGHYKTYCPACVLKLP